MLYDVKAPIEKNSVIGKLKLSYDNNSYESVNKSRKILECRRFRLSLQPRLYIVGKI